MTPEAAAGILTAGRHSHASPAVAPAREGGAAAAERAGTGGCSRRGGRGAMPAFPRRLGIPTPKTDNFFGRSSAQALPAILAATRSQALRVFSLRALAAPASAKSSPGSISSSSARATACSSSGIRRPFRQSLTAARVTPIIRAVSLSFLAFPLVMASSKYREMGFTRFAFLCLRALIIFCTLTVDKMYAMRVRFICTLIADKMAGEIKSEY